MADYLTKFLRSTKLGNYLCRFEVIASLVVPSLDMVQPEDPIILAEDLKKSGIAVYDDFAKFVYVMETKNGGDIMVGRSSRKPFYAFTDFGAYNPPKNTNNEETRKLMKRANEGQLVKRGSGESEKLEWQTKKQADNVLTESEFLDFTYYLTDSIVSNR